MEILPVVEIRSGSPNGQVRLKKFGRREVTLASVALMRPPYLTRRSVMDRHALDEFDQLGIQIEPSARLLWSLSVRICLVAGPPGVPTAEPGG